MEEKKDFLSQLHSEKKPDSFQDEQVTTLRKDFTKPIIAGVIAFVLIVAGIFGFMQLGKVEVPNMEGWKLSEAGQWSKQNGVQIVIKTEYSIEVDKEVVIKQSIKAGDSVKKNDSIIITISDGADPDELIKFPDFKTMNASSILNWINTNKLISTKIASEYSDTVAKDEVIKYELASDLEANFKRGSKLTITVSKGVKPVEEVMIEVKNLVGMTLNDVITWAESNGLKITKKYANSDAMLKDSIISQSIKDKEKVKKGTTIEVTVSKGKSVKVPDLGAISDLTAWQTETGVKLKVINIYNNDVAEGKVISQSVAKDKYVDQGSEITVYVSKGLIDIKKYSDTLSFENDIAEFNKAGANLKYRYEYTYSELPKGTIIDHSYANSKVKVGTEIVVTVSKGAAITLPDFFTMTKVDIDKWATDNGITFVYDYADSNLDVDQLVKYTINGVDNVAPGTIISNGDNIKFYFSNAKNK